MWRALGCSSMDRSCVRQRGGSLLAREGFEILVRGQVPPIYSTRLQDNCRGDSFVAVGFRGPARPCNDPARPFAARSARLPLHIEAAVWVRPCDVGVNHLMQVVARALRTACGSSADSLHTGTQLSHHLDGRCPRRDAQFAIDRLHLRLHGVARNEEPLCDLRKR
jgi:hypothetical protein